MGTSNQRLLELLERKGKSLYKLLFRLTLSEETAEELMQELFVRLGKSKRCSDIENLYAYARKTALNLAFDYYRRIKSSYRKAFVFKIKTIPARSAPRIKDFSAFRHQF